MKKKTAAVILSVLIAGIAVTAAVMADEWLVAETPEVSAAEEVAFSSDNKTVPAFENANPTDADAGVFQKLNKSGKSKNEIYDDMYLYMYFKKLYKPDKETLEYMESLMTGSADMLKLINIFDFWQTTCEDISIVGKIYAMSGTMDGAFWVEELYNQATGNRHGVLDSDGVAKYMSMGFTANEIAAANILSRRGVYTITDILDKVSEGTSWADIIAVSVNEEKVTVEIVAFNQKWQRTPANAVEPLDLLECMDTAKKMSVEIDTILEADGSVAGVHTKFAEHCDAIRSEVHIELLKAGIVKRKSENTAVTDSMKKRAIENGMTDDEIEKYLDNGYQIIDILNASEKSKAEGVDTELVLITQRNELINGTDTVKSIDEIPDYSDEELSQNADTAHDSGEEVLEQ